MRVARGTSVFHRLIPAGGWLLLAHVILRSALAWRHAGLIGRRRALAWGRLAGRTYRTGFAVWRANGGKWR